MITLTRRGRSTTKTQFASLLLSRIPIPTSPPGPNASKREKTLYEARSVLIFSLSNVHREAAFFVDTAKEHGLELFPGGQLPLAGTGDGSEGKGGSLLGPYEPTTRAYVDFLWATAAGGTIEDGFVLLWAMEVVS